MGWDRNAVSQIQGLVGMCVQFSLFCFKQYVILVCKMRVLTGLDAQQLPSSFNILIVLLLKMWQGVRADLTAAQLS